MSRDVEFALRRETDPQRRPDRTPEDFKFIKEFIRKLYNEIKDWELIEQSDHTRNSMAEFFTKYFAKPGYEFCRDRLNFHAKRSTERKRKREEKAEDVLVQNAKQRRVANPALHVPTSSTPEHERDGKKEKKKKKRAVHRS